MMENIVIIGGGAAAASVLGELVHCRPNAAIQWVAGNTAALGRGTAYATEDAGHLLNVRAAEMALHSEQDEDFLDHVTRQDATIRGTDFVPRRLFGDFIEAQLRVCMKRARKRQIDVGVHHQNAVRLEQLPDGTFIVSLRDGRRLDAADTVILAIGALPPGPLRGVSQQVLTTGRYVLVPGDMRFHNDTPERILVIGTGLTAVDTLLTAARKWPKASLAAVSRHGRLPFAHSRDPLPPFPHQDDINSRLLSCQNPLAMLRLIRQTLEHSRDPDWHALIDGMRPVNARLWTNMSLDQRRQFLRHLRWLWEAARHRMAPESADVMQQLMDTGRLRVHAARIQDVVDAKTHLAACIRRRSSRQLETLETDLIIQTTGLNTDISRTRHALIAQLVEDGLVRPDPLRLGPTALTDGRLIGRNGRVTPGLYAMGSLLRGTLWECTAMAEIRGAAHAFARTPR